jgi:bifunctional DNA-binding transcriptional regulator/antitoxin component of YhaV-PrlF toxin-antitoxin module
MKITLDEDGRVRIPAELLEEWGVSPGRSLEARVDRGRLVLQPLAPEGDPFADGPPKPDEKGFEKAMRKDAEEKERAREAFERALREKHDIDLDKEREERDRWT